MCTIAENDIWNVGIRMKISNSRVKPFRRRGNSGATKLTEPLTDLRSGRARADDTRAVKDPGVETSWSRCHVLGANLHAPEVL